MTKQKEKKQEFRKLQKKLKKDKIKETKKLNNKKKNGQIEENTDFIEKDDEIQETEEVYYPEEEQTSNDELGGTEESRQAFFDRVRVQNFSKRKDAESKELERRVELLKAIQAKQQKKLEDKYEEIQQKEYMDYLNRRIKELEKTAQPITLTPKPISVSENKTNKTDKLNKSNKSIKRVSGSNFKDIIDSSEFKEMWQDYEETR